MPIDPIIPLSIRPPDIIGAYEAAERVKGAQKENRLLDLALQAEEAEQARLMQPPDYADFVETGLESLLAVGKTIKTMLGDEATPEKRTAILEMLDDADRSIAGRYEGRQFPGLGEFREKVKSEDAAAIHDSIDELFDIVDMANRVRSGDPAAVREYQFFESLPDSKKEEYLRVKRATTQFATVGQVPGQFNRETNQFNPAQTPEGMATLGREVQGARAIAEGKETGTQQAQIAAIDDKAGAQRQQAAIDAAPGNIEAAEARIDTMSDAITAINGAKEKIGFTTTGVLGWVSSFKPGSKRQDLEGYYTTIKGILGTDALEQMGKDSASGASGMGALNTEELRMIQSLVVSLDADLSPERQIEALNQLNRHMLRQQKLAEVSRAVNEGLIPKDQALPIVKREWLAIDQSREEATGQGSTEDTESAYERYKRERGL